MKESPQPAVFLLGSIFPTEKFPLRARAVFPVLDHFNEQVALTQSFVPGVELTSPARIRATIVAYYQRPFETIFNQAHGLHVQIVFLTTRTEFKFVRRHQLAKSYEYFVNDGSIEYRRVEWSEFVRLAGEYFTRAECTMKIEDFLDQNLNVALVEAQWGGCGSHIE